MTIPNATLEKMQKMPVHKLKEVIEFVDILADAKTNTQEDCKRIGVAKNLFTLDDSVFDQCDDEIHQLFDDAV